MIKLSNLNKYYFKGKPNQIHVINNVSLELPDKGLVAIFGDSGSGKTTLLNVIGGLDKVNSGEIIYQDVVVDKYRTKKVDNIRNEFIGYIFQNYNLLEDKTIYGNIELSLNIIGINDKDEIEKRVDYALKAVGLDKFKHRSALALSGGQQQRVAIARAIAKNPKIIIADEPTGNLDSNNTFDVMSIIKKISEERLVILVTHEKLLVDFYADRVLEIKDGKIVNDYLNKKAERYSHKDERNIYLGDYQKQKLTDNDNVSVNVYAKEELEKEKINIDIVIKAGVVYIKPVTTGKMHIVDNESEINFIDGVYEDVLRDDYKQNKVDLDQLGEVKEYQKKSIIPFMKYFKEGIKKVYRKKSLTNLLAISMVVLGILIGYFISAFGGVYHSDEREYIKKTDDVISIKVAEDNMDVDSTLLKKQIAALEGIDLVKYIDKDQGIWYRSFDFTIKNYTFQTGDVNISTSDIYILVSDYYDYDILMGRDIENANEILISTWQADEMFNNYNTKQAGIYDLSQLIGSFYSSSFMGNDIINSNVEYEVVGIVDIECQAIVLDKNLYDFFFSNPTKEDYVDQSGKMYVHTNDKEALIRNLDGTDLFKDAEIVDYQKNAHKVYLEEYIDRVSFLLSAITFLGIILIAFLILLTRSIMMSRIKEIGILRCIGASKKDIYKMFAAELIGVITTTVLIGYLIMSFISVQVERIISGSIFNELINHSVLYMPIYSFVLGLVLIYGLFVFFGLLPIFTLLRKTPIQIVQQYDI